MFFRKKQKFSIGDDVVFTKDVITKDMFGLTNIVKRGTKGKVTDKNVKTTVYDIRHIRNIEVTYENKERVLLAADTDSLEKQRNLYMLYERFQDGRMIYDLIYGVYEVEQDALDVLQDIKSVYKEIYVDKFEMNKFYESGINK